MSDARRPEAASDLARANATIAPRETHGGLIDMSTRDVWLTREPVERAWWEALTPEPPLVKSGFGRGAMDRAWFRRSPGASEDGPLRTREIAGCLFQLVARPELPAAPSRDFPRRLLVHKHHVIAYAAGRHVSVLRSPAGEYYVPLVAPREGGTEAPPGWSLEEIRLAADWELELPAPTETWWFASGASFQGPVSGPAGKEGRTAG